MARKNALIRFFYLKNPNKLTDDVWAKYYSEIDYVLKYTGQMQPKE